MLRPARPQDHPAILGLNAASVAFLSPLDGARLAWLDDIADLHLVAERAGQVLGFLLCLREGTAYDSSNYRWFAARHPRFVYIDRVVVSEQARGQGVAQALYAECFAHARRTGVPIVVCEYDLDPPNPASARFHAAQGFREIGQDRTPAGKAVSMQLAEV